MIFNVKKKANHNKAHLHTEQISFTSITIFIYIQKLFVKLLDCKLI